MAVRPVAQQRRSAVCRWRILVRAGMGAIRRAGAARRAIRLHILRRARHLRRPSDPQAMGEEARSERQRVVSDPFLSFVGITIMSVVGVTVLVATVAIMIWIIWWIDQKLPQHFPDWAAPALFFGVWNIRSVIALPSDAIGASATMGFSLVIVLLAWWQIKRLKRKAALATED